VYELLQFGVGGWRISQSYPIILAMKRVSRGLIASLFWMGVALGVTSALSDLLHDRSIVDAADGRFGGRAL
jgi:hypothetical protein